MRKYFCKCFTVLLLFFSVNAFATDTFNTTNSYLSIDSVVINGIKYNDVVVQLLSANLISMGSYAPVTVSATCSDSNFTNAIFNAISVGMTLSQVTQTIGCDPKPGFPTVDNMTVRTWEIYKPTIKFIEVFFIDNVVPSSLGNAFKVKYGF